PAHFLGDFVLCLLHASAPWFAALNRQLPPASGFGSGNHRRAIFLYQVI
ncbi:hypothetical protein LCGC14_3138650, partial [marine sediment metagenome]